MDYQTLNLLVKCSKEFSHKKIRLQDLSDTESMICSYIHSHHLCSQENVSTALKTDKTTVTKAIASLEKKGCLVRTKDPNDKRVKRLSLTDDGKERIASLLDLHNSWLDRVMSSLSKDERKQFENCCAKLLAAAEKLNNQ